MPAAVAGCFILTEKIQMWFLQITENWKSLTINKAHESRLRASVIFAVSILGITVHYHALP